jgi:polyphosphate kinase 2 (PPK2 family)
MSTQQEQRIDEYARLFRVRPGSKVTLADDFDPGFKADFLKKNDGAPLLRRGVAMLADYQARLAAQDTYGVLVCLQSLDAGGKDGEGVGGVAAPLPRDQRLGALPHRQRLPDREALPEPLEGGAAHPVLKRLDVSSSEPAVSA